MKRDDPSQMDLKMAQKDCDSDSQYRYEESYVSHWRNGNIPRESSPLFSGSPTENMWIPIFLVIGVSGAAQKSGRKCIWSVIM